MARKKAGACAPQRTDLQAVSLAVSALLAPVESMDALRARFKAARMHASALTALTNKEIDPQEAAEKFGGAWSSLADMFRKSIHIVSSSLHQACLDSVAMVSLSEDLLALAS